MLLLLVPPSYLQCQPLHPSRFALGRHCLSYKSFQPVVGLKHPEFNSILHVFLYLQGRPITPVYAMAHNVQRIPTAGGLYGAGYIPITNYAANTAALAALQKNAAVAAAAYGGYTGYAVPQAFPTATFQLPLHDVYQTYWFWPLQQRVTTVVNFPVTETNTATSEKYLLPNIETSFELVNQQQLKKEWNKCWGQTSQIWSGKILDPRWPYAASLFSTE